MNRLKRGYAVRSIDAITHPDQLPLRQADLTNAIGRAGPDGHHHPSSPGAPLQSAEPHSMIHSWRALCLPWPHPPLVRGGTALVTVPQPARHAPLEAPRAYNLPPDEAKTKAPNLLITYH